MTATVLEPRYRAQIEGDVFGQVAVGEHVIQIGHMSGGKLEVYQGGPPRRRHRPVEPPRPFPHLLGRQPEVDLVIGALQRAEVVEIAARAGMGKTSLVRHIAQEVPPLADGLVHRASGPRALEDVLQLLFDAFYTSDLPLKRNYGELVSALNGLQALIYLDDLDLEREEVERLLDALRASTVLFVSPERRLWSSAGRSLSLRGLPPAGALALLERELGRKLAAAEREAAQEVVQQLEGHPLTILQAAARAREDGIALVDLAQELQTAQPAQALAKRMLGTLSNEEKQVVAALAAVGEAPLHEEHLESIATPLAATLEKLMVKGVIQAHSPEYSLADNMRAAVPADWLPPWQGWLRNHFGRWVNAHRREPERLVRDVPAMEGVLAGALATGRYAEALHMIQAVEPALALDRQWAASARWLTQALQAAQATGNQAAAAWTLHQQGTYALGLGENDVARGALQQALGLREQLGDEVGAALTRHNLSFVAGPPPPPSRPEPEPGPEKPPSLLRPVLVGVGLLAAVSVLVLVLILAINILRPEPREELPDLVVERWAALGDPFRGAENFPNRLAAADIFLVPVELVVQNRGPAEAGPFFVSVHSRRGPCDAVLPFVVEGQPGTTFPEIEGVPANDRRSIEGVVGLLGAGPGEACDLVAIVDSAEPDPDGGETGRIREQNEGNNQSPPLTVRLGEETRDTPPEVEIISPKEEGLYGFAEFDDTTNRWVAFVPLEAVAFDEEDGELPPEAFRWETNRGDLQEPFLGTGNFREVPLYGSEDQCAATFHEVTVTVMDSAGNMAQATVRITLRTIC